MKFDKKAFPTVNRFRQVFRHGVGSRWRVSSFRIHESTTAKQRSLLRVLAIAHREKLDASHMVKNLANEHHGVYRRRLHRLAKRLSTAVPWVDALEQTPDVLSDEMMLAIRFGSQSGTLPSTLDQLLSTHANDAQAVHSSIRQSLFYLCGMTCVFFVVLLFLAFKIMPIMSQMANEFEWELPTALEWLISACSFLESTFVLWLLLAMATAWFVTSRTMRRIYRRLWASRYLRPVARLRSAELLQLLAPAVGEGRPLGGSLSTLARYHYDRNVRTKLLYARNEVEQGADPWDSLAAAGLLSGNESHALSSSSSSGTRAWLMRRLADRRLQQFGRRTALLLSLVQPLIVLVLAGIVLWIGLAFFGFLGGIIHALA